MVRVIEPSEDGAAVWRESAPEGGAVCGRSGRALLAAEQLQGKELSYNNSSIWMRAGRW